MATGVSLIALLSDLRQEARISVNAAHNASSRDGHVRLLQRTQETLWRAYDWRHLEVRRYAPLQAGQRYYDSKQTTETPSLTAAKDDLEASRVLTVDVRYGEEWKLLHPGIDREHYSTYDSDLDERSWPVERWRLHENALLEVWPIPEDNADTTTKEGYLRLVGTRALRPLVADADVCDLDGDLLVLYGASELLAAQGARDAGAKREAADKLLASLTGNDSKLKTFSMIGSGDPRHGASPRRGPPRVHYRET